MSELLLDAAGRRRSPATLPEFHAGRPPRNKGIRYPADPPTIEEIVAVMRAAGDGVHGRRLRGLIVVLWRSGLRIHEALALAEADLDSRRGSLLVRRGKGGRRREVGMVTNCPSTCALARAAAKRCVKRRSASGASASRPTPAMTMRTIGSRSSSIRSSS
jgi:integrase